MGRNRGMIAGFVAMSISLVAVVGLQKWREPASHASLEQMIKARLIREIEAMTPIEGTTPQDIELTNIEFKKRGVNMVVEGDIAIRRRSYSFLDEEDGFKPAGQYRSTFYASGFLYEGPVGPDWLKLSKPKWNINEATIDPSRTDLWSSSRANKVWEADPPGQAEVIFDGWIDRCRIGFWAMADQDQVLHLLEARWLRVNGHPKQAERALELSELTTSITAPLGQEAWLKRAWEEQAKL